MTNIRCLQCGLLNFAAAAQCKKCGAELAQQVVLTGSDDSVRDGLPDGLKLALILVTACVVCTLGIFWIKSLLPDGSYPVIFFVPFAFVGLLAGMIVMSLLNVIYKGLRPARQLDSR